MGAYTDKNVIVTGGAGFIGTHLVKTLYHIGAKVTIFDLVDKDHSMLPAGVQFVKGDILDESTYGDIFADADYVFHLAARTDLNGETLEAYRVNHEGTRNIIEALKNNQNITRLVVFSTQLVIGIFDEKRFIEPTEPYKTKTIYGQSKILTEKYTIEDCQKYHIPYLIIRPTSVYGPYGKIPYRDFFLMIKKRRYFQIGKADNLVSMAYVKNVVDQTLFLSCHDQSAGQIFFATDLHPYTMAEFGSSAAAYFKHKLMVIPDFIVYPLVYFLGIFKAIGFNVPLYPFRLKNIKANYCYDIGNTLKLGFFPKYGLIEGIEETLDWYVKNDQDFQAKSSKTSCL
jgi:nucleoside-diphosphate-sugar epimerase